MHPSSLSSSFFFFNDTATTEIYTLSLHDALPISEIPVSQVIIAHRGPDGEMRFFSTIARDIRERKAYEARLQYLANYDPLTSLPNRDLLGDRTLQAVPPAPPAGRPAALLGLDPHRFQPGYDSYSHLS